MLTTNYFNIGDRVCRMNDRAQRFPGSIVAISKDQALIAFDSAPFARARLNIRKLQPATKTQKAGAR
jgi:hypothetical protein